MPRLAVLGHPISHSLSPAIHTAALAELGLAGEWSYEAIEVPPADFEALVRSLPDAGFAGVNVTVPHKRVALELAGDASAAAREIGAANTLSFGGAEVRADNTDAEGFLSSLPEPPAGMRALVLGAGGAARAVVWALVRAGAHTHVWNRTAARAESLAGELGGRVARGEDRAGAEPGGYDLIVNATTVGMGSGGGEAGRASPPLKGLPLLADAIRDRQVVVDLAYGNVESELVNAARARGARVVDGREVLVRQGAASLRIWTGMTASLDVMRKAAGIG